jgi:hypothetical protein
LVVVLLLLSNIFFWFLFCFVYFVRVYSLWLSSRSGWGMALALVARRIMPSRAAIKGVIRMRWADAIGSKQSVNQSTDQPTNQPTNQSHQSRHCIASLTLAKVLLCLPQLRRREPPGHDHCHVVQRARQGLVLIVSLLLLLLLLLPQVGRIISSDSTVDPVISRLGIMERK